MDLFTSTELLIMASVISVLLLIVIIISISEIFKRRKEKDEVLTNEIEPMMIEENSFCNKLENSNLKSVVEENKVETTNIELESGDSSVLAFKEEKVVSVSANNNQLQMNELVSRQDEEIEELVMEINPIEVVKIANDDSSNLDSKEKAQIELLKLEEELEHELSLEDTITNLEAIEEENAIISYQELLSNTKELDIVTCDDGDEPITITEVFKMMNNHDEEPINVLEALSVLPLEEAYHGDFVSSPYLSPISGLETENLSEIQLENTANLEKLEKEIRKTNEFLNILNELKKNLE